MPLMWTHMLIFSTIMMLIMTSFIYFFIPYYPHSNQNTNKDFKAFPPTNMNLWNWKW